MWVAFLTQFAFAHWVLPSVPPDTRLKKSMRKVARRVDGVESDNESSGISD